MYVCKHVSVCERVCMCGLIRVCGMRVQACLCTWMGEWVCLCTGHDRSVPEFCLTLLGAHWSGFGDRG